MGGIIEYSYLLGFLLALIAIFDFLIDVGLKGKLYFKIIYIAAYMEIFS